MLGTWAMSALRLIDFLVLACLPGSWITFCNTIR